MVRCKLGSTLPLWKGADLNSNSWEIGALSVGVDASLYVELHDILTTIPSAEGISLNYTYQPFSVQGVAQGKAKGGNSLNITSENQACGFAVIFRISNHVLMFI